MVFRSLTREQIKEIVDLELNRVRIAADRAGCQARSRPTRSRTTSPKTGYDADYGARPLRRVIQDKLEDRLSEGLLSGEFKQGDTVKVSLGEDKSIKLEVVKSKPSTPKSETAEALQG